LSLHIRRGESHVISIVHQFQTSLKLTGIFAY
jgi:hypothetical protein